MRLSVTPSRLEARPGVAQHVLITITNPGTVIGGYRVRLLGVDPAWVELDEADVSLFPDETATLVATITLPTGLIAGDRRMAVQVRELTPPGTSEVAEVVLEVPRAPNLRVSVDPPAATAGRTGRFSLLVDNTGNTAVSGRLAADDAEAGLHYTFEPAKLDLAPGEHAVVNLEARGRRPFTGAPVVRVLELHLVDGSAPVPVAAQRKRRSKAPPVPAGSEPLANATLVQKARLSRGALSLFGLLVAVTVFATVITIALSRIVDQSTADRELALKIAAARDDAGRGSDASGSGLAGTVRDLTTGAPVPRVTVTVYAADDPTQPLANDATDQGGQYKLGGLPAGDYKLTFRGADFVQTWFPQALDPDNAEPITLEASNVVDGLDVALGGVPAAISGRVLGADVSDASITLRTPATSTTSASGVTVSVPGTPSSGATVQTAPVGSDGAFSLGDVPSPAVYELVVTKEGYAPAVQIVDVRAGEDRKNVEINLVEGNGIIQGEVIADGKPLGNVTVTASSGATTVSTLTLTDGDIGSFQLLRLPTPGTYTLVATADDYASQTLSLTLGDKQELTGVTMTLGSAAGTLSGRAVYTNGDLAPGVTVTVTDGSQTIQTATGTREGERGLWEVGGISVPGSYTITLSAPDLASQTIAVTLDANGVVTGGNAGAGAGVSEITTVLKSSTAVLHGLVTQVNKLGVIQGAGEVTVTLSSGARTYRVTTATRPSDDEGQYRIEGIVPGTYTLSVGRPGITATSDILSLTAGQDLPYPVRLSAPALISGQVKIAGTGPGSGPVPDGYVVELFRASDYPGVVYRTTTTSTLRVPGEPDVVGYYEFYDIDAPETYVIQVRRTRGSTPIGSRNVALSTSEEATGKVVTVRP